MPSSGWFESWNSGGVKTFLKLIGANLMGQTPGICDSTTSKLTLVTTARHAEREVLTSQSRRGRLAQDDSPDGRSAAETLLPPNNWFRALKTKLTCRIVTGALEEQILDRDEDVDAYLQTREPTFRQLYTTLKFEVRRNYHLGQEVTTLRAMIAKIQEELAGTQEREKRARYLAFHDDLTALPNRRFFRERLGCALKNQWAGPPHLAVIYLDLDDFKALNDTYGHATGDVLLNLIAERLAHALRAEDLVSRLGGDEYACLITGVSNRDRLQQIASTLFETVSAPFKIGTLTLNVRPSIGIAVCPSDGTTTDDLMKAADTAMYGAKRKRSSFSFFERPYTVPHLSIVN
jgi:diguanylate cyclase (GGDEF)-like protein